VTRMGEFFAGLVGDGASLVTGLPVGGAATGLLLSYQRKRADEARAILFEALKRAEITDLDVASSDDAAGVVIRFLRAALEGAARRNLKLLAQAIVGKLKVGKLTADEFLWHADILASLSREEILVIGTMYDSYKRGSEQDRAEAHYWMLTKQGLGKGSMGSEERVQAVAGRAQRSGLVTSVSSYGAVAYRITPLLLEIAELVDFQEALAEA
jgi:hypothetical protein